MTLVYLMLTGRKQTASGLQPPGRYPISFWLAVVANLFVFASFQWIVATTPGYVLEIGGRPAHIGLASGLFTLSAVLVRPSVSHWVSRRGSKVVLVFGAALFAISPALYALTSSLPLFMAVRLLHGVGIAAFTTAYTALVADLAHAGRRGEAIGIAGVTNHLGTLFAPALGVCVQARWGYAPHFYVAAGIGVLSVVCLLPVASPQSAAPPGSGAVDRPSAPKMLELARVRSVWSSTLGATGLAVAYGAVISFLPPLAAQRDLAAIGTFFTVFALAMMAAQALAGWLSDRIGRRTVALPGMVLAVAAMVVLGAARSDILLLLSGAALGSSWGLVRASLDTAVVEAVAPHSRAAVLGFFYAWFDIGVGAGAFGLGILAQIAGYGAPFYAAAAWAVLALAGYFVWSRSPA